MHANEELINRFYTAFAKLDADTMVSCYDDDVSFADPVFTDLRGAKAGAMWRMLAAQAKGIEITHNVISADDDRGAAHWEAKYTFSKTGRRVHNVIEASFRFKDGKIIEHRDSFGFWRWTRMALGPIGVLLGWSSLVQGKVRAEAAKNLARFMEKSASS